MAEVKHETSTHPGTMDTLNSLRNHFLIAMPGLEDANFARTVVYICEHNEDGAMGIVINRPTDIRMSEIFSQMEIDSAQENLLEQQILYGGPVLPERGFVIHPYSDVWSASLHIDDQISITTSRDILRALAESKGPTHSCIALGYAGWSTDQLEEEIKQNAWLTVPADLEIMFSLPFSERWPAATRLLGFDVNSLAHNAGHA